MESSVKRIQITGNAMTTFGGSKNTTRRKRKEIELRGVPIGGAAMLVSAPAPLPLPLATGVAVPVPANIVPQDGGVRSVKVILDPSKKKTKNIVLSPAKKVVKLSSGSDLMKKRPAKTLKVSRRIRVSVDGLKKRVHRARTIRRDSQKMPIDALKKELESASLIKEGSKAPEPVLRQMYSDFQVLKQRAL
jgi:hypothetical protein